jgi:hypothetical protein
VICFFGLVFDKYFHKTNPFVQSLRFFLQNHINHRQEISSKEGWMLMKKKILQGYLKITFFRKLNFFKSSFKMANFL